MYMKKIKQKYIWVVDAMLHVHVKFKLEHFFCKKKQKRQNQHATDAGCGSI